MKRYYVISPEYGETIPILDDGTGPMEYGCDVVVVNARTKREAKIIGVKAMRKKQQGWFGWCGSEYGNPFAGIKVEIHECQHDIPDLAGEEIGDEECSHCMELEIKEGL